MKRAWLLLAALWGGCLLGSAQEKPEVKESEPFWYVYLEFESYLAEASTKVAPFLEEVKGQSLELQQPIFGIIFGPSSQEAGRLRWAMGFRLQDKDISVKAPLKKAEFGYTTIATMTYVGRYESVGQALEVIFPFIEESGCEQAGPMILKWLDDAAEVGPEKCRTVVMIPVKKS